MKCELWFMRGRVALGRAFWLCGGYGTVGTVRARRYSFRRFRLVWASLPWFISTFSSYLWFFFPPTILFHELTPSNHKCCVFLNLPELVCACSPDLPAGFWLIDISYWINSLWVTWFWMWPLGFLYTISSVLSYTDPEHKHVLNKSAHIHKAFLPKQTFGHWPITGNRA